MGARLARSLGSENIVDYMELSEEYSIMEISAPPEWTGKTLLENNLRNKYGINVLAIRAPHGMSVSPQAESVIHPDDLLVVMGSNADLSKISRMSRR